MADFSDVGQDEERLGRLLATNSSINRSSSQSNSSDEPLLFDNKFEPSFMRTEPCLTMRTGEDDHGSQDDDPLILAAGSDISNSSEEHHEHYAVDHCHSPKAKHSNTARNQLIGVSVLCLFFMIGEIIGGVYANSLALLTDATHLASDLASFLISLFALWVSTKPATRRMSFGFYRAEILGALISVLVIWVVTGVLFYLAIVRIIDQDYDINADDMLITAGCGVAFNILMGVVLHSEMCAKCRPQKVFGHGHSHGGGGHSHSHSQSNSFRIDMHANGVSEISEHSNPQHTKSGRNIVIRAALIHVLGDLIQSVGVLIAAYIIKYKPDYKLADPICTFLFSVLVLCTTLTVLRDTFFVIMEAVPRDVDYARVKKDIESIDGVITAHSLHIWALTLDKHAASVHLAIGDNVDSEKVLQIATGLLRSKHKMHQSTIQVERYTEFMESCHQCIGPQN